MTADVGERLAQLRRPACTDNRLDLGCYAFIIALAIIVALTQDIVVRV